jgi:hypothetical protein
LATSFKDTAVHDETQLVFVADEDDPHVRDYRAFTASMFDASGWELRLPWLVVLPHEKTGNLVLATNAVAGLWTGRGILGHVGDDHRFRTHAWDDRIEETLTEPGIAFGPDGFWEGPDALPTWVFMSGVIAEALGWFALPTAHHLFIDNAWKRLGEELGRLHYLPDVMVEHMHPAAGKSAWDAGYERTNAPAEYEHDQQAFEAWVAGSMAADVERVRSWLA